MGPDTVKYFLPNQERKTAIMLNSFFFCLELSLFFFSSWNDLKALSVHVKHKGIMLT